MLTDWMLQRSIDDHCRYLQGLMGRCPLDQGARDRIAGALRFVEQKRADRNLNLSVVGEFSSGKSTFINALLRDELLSSDIIQGTTTASTVIRYGRSPAVAVNYKDGSRKVLELGRDTMKGVVQSVTTDAAVSAAVRDISVSHPARILKAGISIIDTPGTNSLERWHEDITKEVIRDVSDSSVILTSAEQPLPDTLITFIHDNLEEVLESAVFVVTKMDLIREREHERQLAYIRQRITQEFGIESPVVLPYTPLFVLHDAVGVEDVEIPGGELYQSLLGQSARSEDEILRLLKKNRAAIQITRLLDVMEGTFHFISGNMKAMQSLCETRTFLLTIARKRNLREFVEETTTRYAATFSASFNDIINFISEKVTKVHDDEIDLIYSAFLSLGSQDEIKRFCSSDLRFLLEESGEKMIQEALSYYSHFTHAGQKVVDAFWKEFSEYYSVLKALDTQELATDMTAVHNLSFIAPSISAYSGEAMKALKGYDGSGTVVSGAGIGAIIGTALFPGVGTAIGAGLGALIGGFFSAPPDLTQIKRETWQKLAPGIDQAFNEIFDSINRDVKSYCQSLAEQIDQQIAICYDEYDALVKKMIKRDEQEKKQLQKDVAVIQKDLAEIAERRCRITEAREKLRAG